MEEGAMRSLFVAFRAAFAAMVLALVAAPAFAEDPVAAADAPWQDVITGQIQAFRDHDAPVAFSFAGAGFQESFPSAEAFFATIIGSGYAPIMESVSHSFGRFEKLAAKAVVQEVRFVGPGQELYGAVYQLTEEESGWRVQGVQMFKEAGVAI
jgi:hypothetical protein